MLVTKIAVFGSTGMLGSTLSMYLSAEVDHITEVNRRGEPVVLGNPTIKLDVTRLTDLSEALQHQRFDYIINAVGLVKQLINDESNQDLKLAFAINSEFPALLNDYSEKQSVPVIQIGTDCVYSGGQGNYTEDSNFDGADVYGLSKISGENLSRSIMTVRTSIIGREIHSNISLMDWFLCQKQNARVKGFSNHFWNGVTTLEFARVVGGIIKYNNFDSGVTHLVPANQVSKFELLEDLAREFNRTDINIEPFESNKAVNRTLSTLYPDKNIKFWSDAGYNGVPTISKMIKNYAQWTESINS